MRYEVLTYTLCDGWNEGLMADGLPYRAECWAMDQITMLTFFFFDQRKRTLER